MNDIGNMRYEMYCPHCYKIKKESDKGGIHCDACVGLIVRDMTKRLG